MEHKKTQIILGRTVEADFDIHQIKIHKNEDEEGLEKVIGSYSDYPQYCEKTMQEYYNNKDFIELHNEVFGNRNSHSIASIEELYNDDYIAILAEQ